MTSLTEVKLLTLLNVTAIKRPRDLDRPGGYRASPVVSRTGSVDNAAEQNGAAASAVQNGSQDSQDGADRPPLKKRKSVNFGGELGPSGSTYLKGKVKGKAKTNGAGPAPQKANGHAEAPNGSSSSGIAAEFLGLADLAEASDDEEATGASASASSSAAAGESRVSAESVELNLAAKDVWAARYGGTSSLLQPEAIASAEKREWTNEATSLIGYGRAVESRPGSSSAQASTQSLSDSKTRVSIHLLGHSCHCADGWQITPALLSSLQKSTPEALTSTSLSHLGTYRDFYLHSMDGEADGTKALGKEDHVRGMRQAVIVHALNHVLK